MKTEKRMWSSKLVWNGFLFDFFLSKLIAPKHHPLKARYRKWRLFISSLISQSHLIHFYLQCNLLCIIF